MTSEAVINNVIATIDRLIAESVQVIVEHDDFKTLQASWLGLHYLIAHATSLKANIKVKVLNVSWRQCVKDVTRGGEFEHCELFHKVYSAEFGRAGGEPFGLLVGDYALCLNRNASRIPGGDNLAALRILSEIAAAAFAPFITSVDAKTFAVDQFRDLSGFVTATEGLSQPEFRAWHQLRASTHARFIGLVLPGVLFNSHHHDNLIAHCNYYPYRRELWGNAVYAYAAVVAASFAQTNWFSHSTGMPHPSRAFDGGLVPGLHAPRHSTDQGASIYKTLTDVSFTEQQEQALIQAGFIPLSALPQQGKAVFFNDASVQSDAAQPNAAARLLQYTLCVCRFAHYIKILGRNKMGRYETALACQQFLNQWLLQYVASNTGIDAAMSAKFPLKEAAVTVFETQGLSKHFSCLIRLNPHLRTTAASASVVLSTALN